MSGGLVFLSSHSPHTPVFAQASLQAQSQAQASWGSHSIRPALVVAASFAILCLTLGCGDSFESQLAEVQSLQGAGEFEASIAPLRKLLASESDHGEANYRLGIALVKTGRPSLAVWPLQKASEDEDLAVQAGLVLATTLMSNGAHEEAVRASTRVLELEADNVLALYTRAQAELSAGHPDRVLEDADHILRLRPGDASAATLKGGALVDLERGDEAEVVFKQLAADAEASDDKNDAARKCAALATFYRSQKDQVSARDTFVSCLEKFPAHSLLQQWVSDFFIGAGQPLQAIEVWRDAVETTPEDLALRRKLADLLYGQDQTDEAYQVVEEAVQLFDTPETWRMLANYHARSGDAKAAREALEQAMERTRNVTPALRFALATTLIDEGEIERAREIEAEINEPAYKNLLKGAILLAEGDTAGALKNFDAGLRLWPNNAIARYMAGYAASRLGDSERAISEFREAVRVADGETDAALRLAEIHYNLGQYKPALQFAERHYRSRSYVDPKAHIIATRSALALGEVERARATLKNLQARDAKSPAPYVELAAIERSQNGAKAALAVVLESNIDLTSPDNATALRAVAGDYVELGQRDKALELASAAVQAHPDSAVLLVLKAQILLDGDSIVDAEKLIAQAIAADSSYAPAYEARGMIASNAGDPDAAIASFEKAADADPTSGEYRYLAARARLQKDDLPGAIQSLRDAVRAEPGHMRANNDLAWLLASSGSELPKALELARRAVRIDRTADTLDTLGYVLLQKGDAAEAATALDNALKLRPGSPSIEYRLGVALAAKGDAEGARDALTKALQSNGFPEAEEARAALAKLSDS
jgi:tetratricopeptide (TPR) repeat protein